MAGLILDQLIVRLAEHKLQILDLPEDEALLYGTSAEFGFHSLLDRAKLRKEINQKRKDQVNVGVLIEPSPVAIAYYARDQCPSGSSSDMLVVRDDAQRAAPFDSHTGGGHRLSTAGRNGLVVARRSAWEIVATAFTVGGDVQSWIRVPRDTQTFEEAMQVYGLRRTLRDKRPSDPAPVLEAALAVRRHGHDGVIRIFVMRACTPGHCGAI